MPFALLWIVLGIIAFYLVAGTLRWLRQELQGSSRPVRKKQPPRSKS